MDLQEKRCKLFARPPNLITTLYALSKIMSYCTNIFEEQYLIEAHNKAKWLCWKHKLHIKAIQHHLILLVINRKLYFSGFMLIYLIPPMFFSLDFLCKHFSFLIHCFLQVRARREWILMDLEQAVCSVNPAANWGTTASPFSLVEGRWTWLRNPAAAGGGSWGLERTREAKRADADGAWGWMWLCSNSSAWNNVMALYVWNLSVSVSTNTNVLFFYP